MNELSVSKYVIMLRLFVYKDFILEEATAAIFSIEMKVKAAVSWETFIPVLYRRCIPDDSEDLPVSVNAVIQKLIEQLGHRGGPL
jgi:hypothetical protein